MSAAAQKGIETLPRGPDGKPAVTPEIRSDNGSCYISKEFRAVLRENGLGHHRIRPHCPEENGLMERANRTLREGLGGEEPSNLLGAEAVMARIVGATTRRSSTAPWDICRRRSSTGATRSRGSRSVGSSCSGPGIGAASGTWSYGRGPWHSKGEAVTSH